MECQKVFWEGYIRDTKQKKVQNGTCDQVLVTFPSLTKTTSTKHESDTDVFCTPL